MSLRSQSVKGVKWNAVGTLTTTALQMLKLFILARILTKQDFGLLAIATMFLGFTEIFANMGLATGIIHKQNISRDQYSSVFWLNLMLSVGLWLLLWAVTPLIAGYYHQPDLRQLIPLLSFTLVIDSFGKMFYTLKTKELDFRFISIVQIVGVTLGVVLTVVLALLGHGVFSLAWGALLQAAITQCVYAVSGLKAYRIRLHFSLGEIRELVSIGLYQLGMQVVDYAANKLDIFLIGRFFSAEVLGVYNLAKELLYKAVQLINPIVTNVAAPAFARFQDDKPKMRRSYAEVLHLLSFVNFPIFMAFFLFAEPLTVLLYGGGMVEMVWFVRVLSVWGMLQSIGNPAGILMVSLGRTDLGFRWTLVRIKHPGYGLDAGAAGFHLPLRLLAHDGVQMHTDAVVELPRGGIVAVAGRSRCSVAGAAVALLRRRAGGAAAHRDAVCRHGGLRMRLSGVLLVHQARDAAAAADF